jgi:hypothetical protein
MVTKSHHQLELERKTEMKNKRFSYGKFIQHVYKPNIDQEKVIELQNRIDHIKHPVKTSIKYAPNT